MTEFDRDGKTPLESYTFTYTEEEMKALRNELDKGTFVKLIVIMAVLLVLVIHSFFISSESQLLGFSLATFLYIGSILLTRFRQRKYLAQYSDKRVAQNVYLYEFFDDCMRATVHRQGRFISCAYQDYTDIERYWVTKDYYVFTIGNFLYMVRKSALCENSRVPEFVCRSNMQKKSENTAVQGEAGKVPEELRTLDRLSLAFFIASLATPFVVFITLGVMSATIGIESFVAGAGFMLCTLVALCSFISGIILKAKGVKRVRNLISGFILTLVFFAFTYMCFLTI